ncbi:MAG: DUF502 domain-containing protein [Rudaea sp.]
MRTLYVKRYLITGLLTIVPLWLTWLVFKFIFTLLSHLGTPGVAALSVALTAAFPGAAVWLSHEWLQSIIAFVGTIFLLYVIGFAANRVFGQRLLNAFETMISRIPLVQTIYGGTKKLMTMLSTKPAGTQRVVLIDFPSPELKSIGFVTRLFVDSHGRELAAVYVPTTPNPTGGYLEIVPVEKLVATDWSMDQAMAFILSGGAVGPDKLPDAAHPAYASTTLPAGD